MSADLSPFWRSRFSLNQATTPRWSAIEVIEASARAELSWVGLWRDPVKAAGLRAVRAALNRSDVRVSSLCRGGWFGADSVPGRRIRLDDNFRAVDEAAELRAEALVLVVGPAVAESLADARQRVAEALTEVAAYALRAGVRLAVEPMHPTYCADRSVIVSLAQALSLVAPRADHVGVVLDSYHLWWDPELAAGVASAADRVFGVQLADWLAPPPDHLNGRGMLGSGAINAAEFVGLAERAGYGGPIELEVFNAEVWARDPQATLDQALRDFSREVASVLDQGNSIT